MNAKKEVYIIGGPNGAGKTTFVTKYLPTYLDVRCFVNADNIASGISPLDETRMQIKAGRIMLDLIKDLRMRGDSFGFESTLAGKQWLHIFQDLKKSGYTVFVFFLNVVSVDLCLRRVEGRVKAGGHHVPEAVIRRRYERARSNFWYVYKEIADHWCLFDASTEIPRLIASEDSVLDKEYVERYLRGGAQHGT